MSQADRNRRYRERLRQNGPSRETGETASQASQGQTDPPSFDAPRGVSQSVSPPVSGVSRLAPARVSEIRDSLSISEKSGEEREREERIQVTEASRETGETLVSRAKEMTREARGWATLDASSARVKMGLVLR